MGCEEFKIEKELIDGKCSEHPDSMPEVIEEENYFLDYRNIKNNYMILLTLIK